jgi:hypothetical protein
MVKISFQYCLPYSVDTVRKQLRIKFEEHANVKDLRVIDMLVIQVVLNYGCNLASHFERTILYFRANKTCKRLPKFGPLPTTSFISTSERA